MTKATTCLANGVEISIEVALQSRRESKTNKQVAPVFYCVECEEVVRPHGAGAGSPAHFEHRARNLRCSLSHRLNKHGRAPLPPRPRAWITTAALASRTAGGDDYIRTKDGEVKGLALNGSLNHEAPGVVVVGKGPRIEARAQLFLAAGLPVPTYMKRGNNAWELVGRYRPIEYRADSATIRRHAGRRSISEVAGILFLERSDEPTVVVRGGGFADPETRKAVEQAAIAFVTAHYDSQHYAVKNLESENLGYDLLAVKPGASLYLEVKGTDGIIPRFFLTRNERKFAEKAADWRLVIVSCARTAPQMQVLTLRQLESTYDLDPLAWECLPR